MLITICVTFPLFVVLVVPFKTWLKPPKKRTAGTSRGFVDAGEILSHVNSFVCCDVADSEQVRQAEQRPEESLADTVARAAGTSARQLKDLLRERAQAIGS